MAAPPPPKPSEEGIVVTLESGLETTAHRVLKKSGLGFGLDINHLDRDSGLALHNLDHINVEYGKCRHNKLGIGLGLRLALGLYAIER